MKHRPNRGNTDTGSNELVFFRWLKWEVITREVASNHASLTKALVNPAAAAALTMRIENSQFQRAGLGGVTGE